MNVLHGRQLLLLLLIIYHGEAAAFILPQSSKPQKLIPTSRHKKSRLSSSQSPNDDDIVPAVYPLSRKKLVLIEEAKKLNTPKGSYSSVGWSNRLGSVLTPAAVPGVYTADRPFYWNKIDVGCRMTVIKQQNGELIVHSPIGIDAPLIRSLEELGEVTHVISPNYEHVKYAHQWAEQYPNAKIWGCPGLMERETNVRWTGEVPFGARPPGFHGGNQSISDDKHQDIWDWEEFQPLHIDTEVNPFTGKSFFNEVIYYHTASKTLLMTDLFWNYPSSDGTTNGQISVDNKEDFGPWELAPSVGKIPFGSTAWKFGMDKIFYPFYLNLMVKSDKRQTFNEIARFITCGGDWEVETIIPAHGDVVRGKKVCREVLEKHFNVQCSLPSVDAHFTSPSVLAWLKKMTLSYKLERGEDFLEVISREAGISVNKGDENDLMQLATLCASSPLAIASHDFLRADEAIYIYGNQAFLDGFGYKWDEFVELPSSKCVETDTEVEERQKLLDNIKDAAMSKTQSNEVDKYDNLVRVRKDGKKILLKGVHLWNVWDISENLDDNARAKVESGAIKPIGQAVWISNVEYLD
uniref:MEKHLA domain-containing protein n=1 Tax=Skeletonema marinoi TaxID=267567 RepID=A0A7S2LGU6_9STRA